MKPLVSIIIPVFNLENYIVQCLNSIVSQDYPNLEIIVVNDGSTDNSLQLVEDFAKTDCRIKVFNRENQGVSSARNFGIQQATGEYVCFVDGDDWISANFISTLADIAVTTKSEVVKCGFLFVDTDTNFKRIRHVPATRLSGSIAYKEYLVGRGWLSSSCASIYSTSFLENNNIKFLKEISVGEDGIFTAAVLLHSTSVVSIDKPLYNVRIRSRSASRKGLTYSYEHRYIDEIDCNIKTKQFREIYKLRVSLSNLYRSALQVGYKEFITFYDSLKKSDLAKVNNHKNRKSLPIFLHVIALVAKNGTLFYGLFYIMKLLGFRV